MWGWIGEVLKSLLPLLEKGIAFLAGVVLGKGSERKANLEKNQKARRQADSELDAIGRLDDAERAKRLRDL